MYRLYRCSILLSSRCRDPSVWQCHASFTWKYAEPYGTLLPTVRERGIESGGYLPSISLNRSASCCRLMCRIFAMAAEPDVPPVIKSRLLREFFQSSAETYSGGWGLGYFTDEGPMVIKEPVKATDSFALPGAIRRAEPGSSWPMFVTLLPGTRASRIPIPSGTMDGCSPITEHWATPVL